MPLPFIVIIDVFKLKTSLPADDLWTSLTDQLKIGKDTTCLTPKSTKLDNKKSKRAQNETYLFLYGDFIVHDFKNKKSKLFKLLCRYYRLHV